MSDILVDRTGGVLRITLNRPERLNSLDTAMVDAISDALADAQGVRVAVITGEGRAFCAGAVMAKDAVNPGILDAIDRIIHTITGAPFPVIAAVNGIAAGVGCSIAVASDLVVAKSSSYFLQAFINIGLMPDGAANELLAASVGRARAMKLVLGGEKLPAPEAEAMGLISHCVPDEEFDATVEALVEKFSNGPTLAYARTKAAVNAASIPTITQTLAREAEGQTALAATSDHAEGVAAFVEKRTASFTGS